MQNAIPMFTPRVDILPPPQRRLWPELSATPDEFILYGGTAIALRLGHRESVDFDFFAFDAVSMDTLLAEVPYLRGAEVVQSALRPLTCRIERGGPVRVSFFGHLSLGQIAATETAGDVPVRVAALIDLAGTKIAVITQRAEAKDYIDVLSLLRAGISLPEMLAAGAAIYGAQFNPLIALKAVAYHGDPALAKIPLGIRRDLADAAKSTNPARLPTLNPRRPARPTS